MESKDLQQLLLEVKQCQVCKAHLPLLPKPVLRVEKEARILLVGQAPGTRVHESGKDWDDKSGENLRRWLRVENEVFYDSQLFAVVPIGLCYPGRGKSGDLPPRKECAPLWHDKILAHLPNLELIILIGAYAQKYYLGKKRKRTLTETVKAFRSYLPHYFVLPHPSPRNNIWQRKNPWFVDEVIPELQIKIREIVSKVEDE